MSQHLKTKLDIIKKSAEILLEHYEHRGFKNTLFETGLKNIIAISDEAIYEINKEKAPGPPTE